MNGFMNNLVDASVQCWGCPVFDRLFIIVSDAAATVYNQFATFCAILFAVMLAFYVINAVWKNMQGGMKDPMHQKSIKTVFINSLVVFTFLGLGVALPRFMTTITFEPVAEISMIYTQSMLQTDVETVNERVTYKPMPMSDDGFFRPELRDTIIVLMKTTITQFQNYMKLGIAVMDSAFEWKALLSPSALVKHIMLFFIGLYLFYGFFKLFAQFCFYFVDIIVAMTFFAFFFPLSLTLVAFKGADNVPSWISGLGKNVGTNQFKNLINAIIALTAAILTYTVIMMIIAKFFAAPGQSSQELMELILQGNVFEADLSDDNLEQLTLASTTVLVYVLTYIYGQIPNVTKMVLGAFDVGTKDDLSKEMATNAGNLTKAAANWVKETGKIIISGGESADKKDGKDKK